MTPHKLHDLGPIVLQCRRKSLLRYMRDCGHGRINFIWALACSYVFGPVLLSLPFILLIPIHSARTPLITDPFWGPILAGWTLFVWACISAAAFALPRRDRLDMHERGIRTRVGWRSACAPFAQLDAIILGERPSVLIDNLFALIGRNELFRKAHLYAVVFKFKDGTTRRVRWVLARFDDRDTEMFLRRLERSVPDLITVSASE